MGFSRQEYWSGVPLPSLYELLMINLALEEGKGKIHIYFTIPGSILLQYKTAAYHRETRDVTEIQGSCYQGVHYEPIESYQMLPKHNILFTHF